jgi:hypothetical protein
VSGARVGVAAGAAEQAPAASDAPRIRRTGMVRRRAITGAPNQGLENRGPLGFGVKQGVRRWIARLRLTFLSKVRAATAGRRPDFRPPGAITVAGLCRSHTGFATIPRRFCRDLVGPVDVGSVHPQGVPGGVEAPAAGGGGAGAERAGADVDRARADVDRQMSVPRTVSGMCATVRRSPGLKPACAPGQLPSHVHGMGIGQPARDYGPGLGHLARARRVRPDTVPPAAR